MKKRTKRNDKNGGVEWQMWGIPLFGGDKTQVLRGVEGWLERGKKRRWIATVNPEFVMGALKDEKFKKILQKNTTMNVVDGVGLVWARKIGPSWIASHPTGLIDQRCWMKRWIKGVKVGVGVLRGEYKNEVTSGSGLIGDLCSLAKKGNYRVFFLGGWENRAERTARFFEKKYKGLKTDWCSGEPEIKNAQVISKINKFKPEILLVAYGMKKQEEWIEKNLSRLDVGMVMGVGRSFDYYSGELKRAPKIWCDMGLEWLYSLIKEPKRWRRQLALPRFVWKVMRNGL